MKSKLFAFVLACSTISLIPSATNACTGITLRSSNQNPILARTIEWGGSDLNSQYVIVPRNYTQQSYIPGGTDGMKFTSRYGYAGLAVEQKEFIAEGINEEGLSAGLFYFPRYGQYEAYSPELKNSSIADLQLVPYILGCCKTIEDVKEAVKQVHVIAIDPRASTVHWRFADLSGKQVVLEITNGEAHFFDNELGVLTNSPGFEWQMTNLNNYVSLLPGSAPAQKLDSIQLTSFGVGSGFYGLPGDITPPSRFVRAAFYQATAPKLDTEEKTVQQCFQILNNFDIPIGIEFQKGQQPTDLPSATQWTSATDITNRRIYYRSMHNSAIRCIDLKNIDFSRITYQATPLDAQKEQPIEYIQIK